MNIIGVVDYMNSDKMSIDAIDKGEYVTQEELDSAIKKAKKIVARATASETIFFKKTC